MLERFVEQTHFTSQEDFIANFKVKVPENFNFGYDVVDAWAAEQPDKKCVAVDKRQRRTYTVYVCGLEEIYRYDRLLFPELGNRSWR